MVWCAGLGAFELVISHCHTHSPVVMALHRLSLAMSPLRMFMSTVSAMSSALWPVTILFTPSSIAPRSRAWRRKTPQKVQLFFRPTQQSQQVQMGIHYMYGNRDSITLIGPTLYHHEISPIWGITSPTYLPHNSIHSPPVELLIRDNLEWYSVVLLIPLHCLEGVIAVASDTLVHR